MAGRYKKLKDVLADAEKAAEAPRDQPGVCKTDEPAFGKITDDQARLMALIGTSQVLANDKARAILRCYLERVLDGGTVTDDQAKAALNIMGAATTSGHREQCNQVLTKYLSQFKVPSPAPKKELALAAA